MRAAPLVAACAVVLAVSGCGDVTPDESDRGTAQLAEGSVLIPPDTVDGRTMESLQLAPRPIPGWGEGTVVVTQVNGSVVAVAELAASMVERDRGRLDDYGTTGPVVAGEPTWLSDRGRVLREHSVLTLRGDRAIELSSRDMDSDDLLELANQVRVPTTEDGAVPGDIIGVIERGEHGAEVALVRYSVRDDSGWDDITVYTAKPAEQAALLALAHADQASITRMETEASCCSADLLRPARQVLVGGVESTVATFTESKKILVVPGDPGIVVLSRGVRSNENVPSDEMLVGIAEGSRAATAEELADVVQERNEAEIARITDELHRQESARGWEVLADAVVDGIPVVISSGTTTRGEPEPDPAEPQLCAVIGDLTGSSPPVLCIPAAAVAQPLVVARGDSAMLGLWFGAVDADATRVRIETRAGSIDAQIITFPQGRVFVIGAAVDRMIELSERSDPEVVAQMAIVARNDAGTELARTLLFPQLSDG